MSRKSDANQSSAREKALMTTASPGVEAQRGLQRYTDINQLATHKRKEYVTYWCWSGSVSQNALVRMNTVQRNFIFFMKTETSGQFALMTSVYCLYLTVFCHWLAGRCRDKWQDGPSQLPRSLHLQEWVPKEKSQWEKQCRSSLGSRLFSLPQIKATGQSWDTPSRLHLYRVTLDAYKARRTSRATVVMQMNSKWCFQHEAKGPMGSWEKSGHLRGQHQAKGLMGAWEENEHLRGLEVV